MERTLIIDGPYDVGPEIAYTLDVVFTEFLGLPWQKGTNSRDMVLGHGDSDKKLIVKSDFFHRFSTARLSDLLPEVASIPHWNPKDDGLDVELTEQTIPIIFGSSGIVEKDDKLTLSLDVFGFSFFMISGFEDAKKTDRDRHARMLGAYSFSVAANFIFRPLVDEYIEVLWTCLKKLWPNLARKKHAGKTLVSCDVDRPFLPPRQSLMATVKSLAADIILRRSPWLAVRRLICSVMPSKTYSLDPFNTFGWYMALCKTYNRKAAFYFLTDNTHKAFDGYYSLDDPRIQELMQALALNGHEIGVHGSYNSILGAEQIRKEKELLETQMSCLGIDKPVLGNRQHYLRWDSLTSPGKLEAAGFSYDTSGGYADVAGFRYGTSREFSMWDWSKHQKLKIKQRPLILMDVSLTAKEYMGLGCGQAALGLINALREKSHKYGGNFTVLWHNSNLLSREERALFESAIM